MNPLEFMRGKYFQDAGEIRRVVLEAPCSHHMKSVFLKALVSLGHPLCSGHMIDSVEVGCILGQISNDPLVNLDDLFALKNYIADLDRLPIHQGGEPNYTYSNGMFVVETNEGMLIFPKMTPGEIKNEHKRRAENN